MNNIISKGHNNACQYNSGIILYCLSNQISSSYEAEILPMKAEPKPFHYTYAYSLLQLKHPLHLYIRT